MMLNSFQITYLVNNHNINSDIFKLFEIVLNTEYNAKCSACANDIESLLYIITFFIAYLKSALNGQSNDDSTMHQS
jgi:hypothetical protein